MILAAKCAPQRSVLDLVVEAGIEAVEIYTDNNWLGRVDEVVEVCRSYPLRYAIHAPSDGYEPDLIVDLTEGTGAEVVVFHNIYWEDEWEYMLKRLKPLSCRVCMENISSAVEPIRYMRRFGIERCLDLEHLILEVNGIFEESFIPLLKQTTHIHMTGYTFGSQDWHTPIHHAPQQSIYLLDLLKKTGYSGFVVSEARKAYQTLEEFKRLYNFFQGWKEGRL